MTFSAGGLPRRSDDYCLSYNSSVCADDSDRSWRFDRVGVALASGWFGQTPDHYTDRLEAEIIPELHTEAAIAMARADLKRSRDQLKTAVLR